MSEAAAQQNIPVRILKHIWREYSIVLVMIIIFVVAGFMSDRFLTVQNMLIILRQASFVGMIALGMTLVIITGGIDLSSGHVVAASGAVLIMLMIYTDIPAILAILACFAVATVIGFINGAFITRFRLPPFIVTLAIGIMVRSIALEVVGGRSISFRDPGGVLHTIGNGTIGFMPISLAIWIFSAIIIGCVLAYTKFGSYVYAVGGNETAARYSGIATNKIKLITYAIIGFCAGVAALLDFSRMTAIAVPTAGDMYEFDAITAAVVGGAALSGGRGKIFNTFIGVIIIGSVNNLMIMLGLSPFLHGLLRGTIILVAVLLQRREKAA